MVKLTESLKSWNTNAFETAFTQEVMQLGLDDLPLQQGLSFSSVALDHDLKIIILDTKEQNRSIAIKLGVFYYGIMSGCSCADDPSVVEEVNEYCELMVQIDLDNGDAIITLSGD